MAKRAHLGDAAMNRAQAIKVKALARLAELVDEGQARGQIATRQDNLKRGLEVRSPDIGKPEPLPIPRQRLAEARKIAKNYTPEDIDRIMEEAEDAVPLAWFTNNTARRANTQGVIQSLTNEWYTPGEYITAAWATLGTIDLDPASCEEANQTVGAARIYTIADDGLTKPWHGRVWLNPPYGRLAPDFIERLVTEYMNGNVEEAIVLVNAHSTDTKWFQPLWDYTLCFTDHRIDFGAGTERRSGSTHGSVFVYLGQNLETFKNNFAKFGPVVRRMP
jgi:ParB family chromosome partitioning protein